MCPPPCGPRRSYYSRPRVIASQRITKAEVDRIIDEEKIECTFKYERMMQPYEGCLQSLHKILHDGRTKVKVAGSRSGYYMHGKRTIEMIAPCFPATIIIRAEE